MSVKEQLLALEGVVEVKVDKVPINGESAVWVRAVLDTGKTVTGTFTSGDNTSFGGVSFDQHKDVVGLMTSKIKAVQKGTHERN